MNGGMAARACIAVLAIVSLAGCGPFDPGTKSAHPTPGDSGFAALSAVALKLPRLEPGQPCPLSKLRQLGPHLGMALGSGPVYMLSGGFLQSDPQHPSKMAWGANPLYSGPIRIRGRRIDGPGEILFDSFDNHWRGDPVKTLDGTHLYPEMDLLLSHSTFPNTPVGWRIWPTGMYLPVPGCYGWQVDGVGFTDLFTFHSLDLLALPAGAACPNSPQQVAHDLWEGFGFGPAVGVGPIYALMGEMRAGVLQYHTRPNGWSPSKVLWMAKPTVSGSVVIRGRQLDGPGWIGFGQADDPEYLLQWEIGSQGGWASLPSEIRVNGAGCYAFQADSRLGSEVIAFQVVEIP